MGMTAQCISYADFQLVVDSLPSKIGNVYYKFTSGGGFFVTAVTIDLSSAVSGSESTLPSSFATDYPNAIQLSATAPMIGSNFNLI